MREFVRRRAFLVLAISLTVLGACQLTSSKDESVPVVGETTIDGAATETPVTGVELVARWIDGALTGEFEDITRLTYGEFGEPEAMERLAEQIHDHARTAPSEPQVTVTDRGTAGTLTNTCFRIDYGVRVDVGMILTRTWPDLGERVWEYRSTGPCDLDPAAIERVVPTWINNTGLTSSLETWQQRLPQVCSQAGLDTDIFDDLLVVLATGYINEDTAAGLSQGGPADPAQAADALWIMAVNVCPELFPPGATEAGPPSSR